MKVIAQARYEICKSCPELRPTLKTCKQCGCFMPLKTKIMQLGCPLGKFDAMNKQQINAVLLEASE